MHDTQNGGFALDSEAWKEEKRFNVITIFKDKPLLLRNLEQGSHGGQLNNEVY